MASSLSRTTSLESATSSQTSQTDNGDELKQRTEHSLSNSPNEGRPFGIKSRTPSHSLLSSSPSSSSLNRKGRFADAGTSGVNVGRASISMPPPATKPSSVYRPSNNRYPSANVTSIENGSNRGSIDIAPSSKSSNESAIIDDMERTPQHSTNAGGPSEPPVSLTLPEPDLKPPSDTDGNSNRLSFSSSLYSLGSAIYSSTTGAASAPQSTASSNAGSVKNTPMEQRNPQSAPLSPTKSSLRGEVSGSATTATDFVSVTANAQLQHSGQTARK